MNPTQVAPPLLPPSLSLVLKSKISQKVKVVREIAHGRDT